ncbi:MAG: class I SAM-dependent methyltransferase [Gammaproteobacteria bacterium]
MNQLICSVCGCDQFEDHNVLWPALIDSWGISPYEVNYINQQQGRICSDCGTNIRSAALAKALCLSLNHPDTLDEIKYSNIKHAIFEINEAGTLHSRLKQFPGHVFGAYPECDMTNLTYQDSQFDIIIHSDTLEHVPAPKRALAELRRVLVPGGVTIFTVPIIVGKMTRSRDWLPATYHGAEGEFASDYKVFTEFGADIWCMVMEAGFSACSMIPYAYPAGIAIIATR